MKRESVLLLLMSAGAVATVWLGTPEVTADPLSSANGGDLDLASMDSASTGTDAHINTPAAPLQNVCDVHQGPVHSPPGAAVESLPSSAAAPIKPSITIAVADFHCPPCEQLKAMDWQDFDVSWQTGGAPMYPEISWLDSRGVKRVLYGPYKPWQVKWSWERTQ